MFIPNTIAYFAFQMIHPVGIQRRRTKGFNLAEYSKSVNGLECINVCRPSLFGNPFRLIGDMIYVDAGHRRKILSKWVLFYQDGGHTVEEVVQLYRHLLIDSDSHNDVEQEVKDKFKWMRDRITDLEGKNLACFCKEGSCCHREVLIEFSNNPIYFNLLKK